MANVFVFLFCLFVTVTAIALLFAFGFAIIAMMAILIVNLQDSLTKHTSSKGE